MSLSKQNKEEIQIPKTDEYLELIATEDDIKLGSLFFDSSRERILIISEINEEKDWVRLSQYDPLTKKIVGGWTTESRAKIMEEYSERFIPDYDKYSKEADEFLFNGKEFEVEDFNTESTSLVHNTNKHMLESMHGAVELKRKKADLIKSMVSIKIAEQKNRMMVIKRKMEGQIAIFNKEMRKIMKVICMIELYLGIEEELYKLQEGESAELETPISLRQMVLFADEELGNCDDGGIDFTQLDKFDEWLVKDGNYKILLPEIRGIVAIKPRRYDKEYRDRDLNIEMNRWNKQTYFLIRNGDNLYRVCSPNIGVGETMFPKRKEFQDIVDKISESTSEYEQDRLVEDQEDMKNMYMKTSLFIQGLIDRTEVFSPLPLGIKITDIEENNGFNLIYDAENLLPSGRLSFKEWMSSVNENVGKGSRIVLVQSGNENGFAWNNGINEGYFKYYDNDYSKPGPPSTGLYTIEEQSQESNSEVKVPIIRYRSDSNVYSWTGCSERKNRISWIISYDHSWYLNYDRISLDDIDFYLNSRIERANYLTTLPVLRELRKHLREEQKKEVDFKLMLQGMVRAEYEISEEYLDMLVQESIDWWKFKNIWKRPITQDDAKATRMIGKYLLKLVESKCD